MTDIYVVVGEDGDDGVGYVTGPFGEKKTAHEYCVEMGHKAMADLVECQAAEGWKLTICTDYEGAQIDNENLDFISWTPFKIIDPRG